MFENEGVANHSAMSWAESIKWVWKPGDSPRKGEGWHRKANEMWMKIQQKNEEHRQMKIKKIKIQKWNEEQQLTSQKPPRGFYQAKYHRWEFLTL